MLRVLVVEDNDQERKRLVKLVNDEGYEVSEATASREALEMMTKKKPHLVLMDLDLPDIYGMDICLMIREAPELYGEPAIIIVSSDQKTKTVCEGFRRGTVDYIKKPYDENELLLRIKAALIKWDVPEEMLYRCGPILINDSLRKVFRGHEEIYLRKKEYDTLVYLFKNKNLIVTRDKLSYSVWSEYYTGESRVLDETIRGIRKKLHDIEIKTIIGHGYQLLEK